MEDHLDPTQDNAPHKQWGRGTSPPAATVQHGSPGSPISAGTGPARGWVSLYKTRMLCTQPGIWEVLMGGRECFQAWGSSKTGWNGVMQSVDAEGAHRDAQIPRTRG